jgi:4-amino-4-deoxy-L-arabinose transferase-like glycosyltransferase
MYARLPSLLASAKRYTPPWLLLLLIVAIGASLRIPGIWHAAGSHPDERHMVSVVMGLSWEDLNPRSFAYGSLSYYSAFFSGSFLATIIPSLDPAGESKLSYDNYFILGRSLAVLFGLLTVVATYRLGRLVYGGSAVPLVAAALLATNFLHIQLSRFFTSDILLTLLTTCCLIGIVRIAKEGGLRAYLVTGLFLGLALATKVSALYLGAPIAVAIGIDWWVRKTSFKKIVLGSAVLLAAAALLLLCTQPYMVLDFDTFRKHTMEQINMVRGEWRPPYTIQYEGTTPYLYPLLEMARYTIGWPVFTLMACGTVAAARRVLRTPLQAEVLMLVWVGAVFLASAGLNVTFPRYLLPIYPALFLIGASLATLMLPPHVRSSDQQPNGTRAPPEPSTSLPLTAGEA